MPKPKRHTAASAQLLVVDLQERLLPVIQGWKRVRANAIRLIQAAELLGVPVVATVQYPKGLGPTVPEVAALLNVEPIAKMTFSAVGPEEVRRQLDPTRAVVLSGIETHVCMAQTALDLLNQSFTVIMPLDAVSSRDRVDHDAAVQRLVAAGVIPTTTEAVLFEWLETAEHPHFKAISKMVKEFQPEA